MDTCGGFASGVRCEFTLERVRDVRWEFYHKQLSLEPILDHWLALFVRHGTSPVCRQEFGRKETYIQPSSPGPIDVGADLCFGPCQDIIFDARRSCWQTPVILISGMPGDTL